MTIICAQDEVYSQTQFQESSQVLSTPPTMRQKSCRYEIAGWFSQPKSNQSGVQQEQAEVGSDEKGLNFIPRSQDNENMKKNLSHLKLHLPKQLHPLDK